MAEAHAPHTEAILGVLAQYFPEAAQTVRTAAAIAIADLFQPVATGENEFIRSFIDSVPEAFSDDEER